MRRLLIPASLVLAACAPPMPRPVGPVPGIPSADVAPPIGPDGESPIPAGGPAATTPARPVLLATAVPVSAAAAALREQHLLIPVAGIGPDRIENTFTEPRDGGE